MKKQPHVNIIQCFQKDGYNSVFGLGDDGKIYLYEIETRDWSIWG